MVTNQKSLIAILPKDYLDWLNRTSKESDARCTFPIGEVSPLEKGVVEDFISIADDVLSRFDGDNLLLHFGSNIYGSTVCLSLNKNDYGYIYYYDNEERLFWGKSNFERFNPMPSQISDFLEARENEELSQNKLSLKNYYHVANSLKGFFAICTEYQLDEYEDTDNENELYDALENCNELFLSELIVKNPEWKNEFGITLTQICACDGLLDSLTFLVEKGVSTEKCLKFSRSNNQKKIEEYLLLNNIG
ncbi:MAG: SMI1/KNR4 family protein [Alteromonadales bacterium]|nr:SMI1/KNR4 family protein [Alteromonadales bacterium]